MAVSAPATSPPVQLSAVAMVQPRAEAAAMTAAAACWISSGNIVFPILKRVSLGSP